MISIAKRPNHQIHSNSTVFPGFPIIRPVSLRITDGHIVRSPIRRQIFTVEEAEAMHCLLPVLGGANSGVEHDHISCCRLQEICGFSQNMPKLNGQLNEKPRTHWGFCHVLPWWKLPEGSWNIETAWNSNSMRWLFKNLIPGSWMRMVMVMVMMMMMTMTIPHWWEGCYASTSSAQIINRLAVGTLLQWFPPILPSIEILGHRKCRISTMFLDVS